jgi:hypothetical protein
LTIHEPEAVIVRRIFAAFVAGESVAAIRDGLNRDGIAPPETETWKRDTLEKLLKRRVYQGDVEIAARRDISGRLWPAVVTEGAHPAIVDRETWRAAQRRFKPLRPIQRGGAASPFAGRLLCAACGAPLYVVSRQRVDRPNPLRMARCASYVNRVRNGAAACPPCPGKPSRALAAVEAAAVDAVAALLDGLRDDAAIIDAAKRIAAATETNAGDEARKRLQEIGRRRARLLEAYESGALELATWQARERVLSAEHERQQAIVAAQPPEPDVDRLLAVRAALSDLPRSGLDYRWLLTELDAMIAVDLDTLTARVIVGAEYAPLVASAVADAP